MRNTFVMISSRLSELGGQNAIPSFLTIRVLKRE